ncbi:lysozyme inhibitor LprI family protein [Paenochrobactrum pullorum]|uniref:lysozyme inhibitor LprI family protein n=1 Tax=Paenochrobactrum pullorum TaxID=1324351 RepID=UPI0035BC596B
MLKLSLFTACSIFLISQAYAATDCSTVTDQTSMTKCAQDELYQADHKLNQLYQTIEKRLADATESKALLISAQRAWIAFRDSECNFSTSGTQGGSVHPMMLAMCKASLTKARNQQLADYLKCEEGDLACVVPAE